MILTRISGSDASIMIDAEQKNSDEPPVLNGTSVTPPTSAEMICVLATLPPPVTGMTVVTAAVVDAMKVSRPVVLHNWSDGHPTPKWKWRISKAIRSLGSAFYLIKWRIQGFRTLYTVANSGGGLYYNLLVTAIARVLNFQCFLHHHVFAYINRPDWRMRLLLAITGESGVQVFLAPEMQSRFEAVYGRKSPGYVLSNIFIVPPAPLSTPASTGLQPREGLTLGHLSNLTMEKGLGRVIATFELLISRSQNVRLILAGPVAGKEEKQLIARAIKDYGDKIEYRGAVYGDDKAAFFNAIDVFLFPTAYKNEAQPLVIAEALCFSKPVIAFALACIPSLIGAGGGVAVPCDQDFAEAAAGRIQQWLSNPEDFANSISSVQTHLHKLRQESGQGIQRLIQMMSSAQKTTSFRT
jgi:glycosyltransferase involved in cell wall biosynthesis